MAKPDLKSPELYTEIPSLRWPAICITGAGLWMIQCFLDFTIDREEDAWAALGFFPVTVLIFIGTLKFYGKRLEDRERWREARYVAWLRKPLPVPSAPDWAWLEQVSEKELEQELRYDPTQEADRLAR